MGKMNKIEVQEEVDNILPFLKLDGKGPSDPWLFQLADGTIFLTRERNDKKSFVLLEFMKVGRKGNFILLSAEKEGYNWIDAERFCNRFELASILKVLEKKDENNGEGNSPQSGSS